MSIFEKFATRTLIGALLLNMIIYSHYIPNNIFNYLYSYLHSINDNIFTKEKTEILFIFYLSKNYINKYLLN